MALLKATKYKQMLKEPLRLAYRIIEKKVPCILRHGLDTGEAVWKAVAEIIIDSLLPFAMDIRLAVSRQYRAVVLHMGKDSILVLLR